MLRLIGTRLLQMIPVLLGVTFFTFILVNLLPGNVIFSILGADYSQKAAAVLTKQLHLNVPVVPRYFEWLGSLLQGHLGNSIVTNQSVGSALRAAVLPTVELVVIAQILAIVLAVTFAMVSVISPWRWVDRLATAISLFGNSVPAFVTGIVLIIIFSVHFHLVSSLGWAAPGANGWGKNTSSIFMPSLVLSLSIFPGYMRIFRREMYDQTENEDYVALGRMKGISSARLIVRHVARNSSLGIITLIGLNTGQLIGGAVIVEQIFAIPGIGTLLLNSINQRDAPMVEGCIVVIAVVIVALNLLTDIGYALLDSRVRSAAR